MKNLKNNLAMKQSNNKQGFLLVIEGIDGSGKTTQVELLTEYLAGKNIPFETISFPQYGKNEYAIKIREYLDGKSGDMDPHALADLYAKDRLTSKDLIKKWLSEGKIVVANRYVSSSKAHIGAKLPENELGEMIDYINVLEYKTNGMSKEDLTILLHADPNLAQANAENKDGSDIHEEDINHLKMASKIYLELAKLEQNWAVLDCMTDGKMKSKEEIHKLLLAILNNIL